ncbi:MAG TPA: hypothetical protein PLJ73_09785 [Myxococcota bacterium]|nr:hypothetical protein [Myxococcota bacterium]
MPRIVSKINDPKIETEIVSSFLGGLNTFQDETLIKDGELTKAKNILLSVDGIEPRPGTSTYGSSSGSKVLGLFGFYKSDGTRQFLRYAYGANNKLQKYVSGVPTDIGSTTFDASARMNFVQARDLLFGFNGIDSLWKYDGTTITVYSALTTPTGLTVTPTGTTGSTAYSYRISAFNSVGETLACVSVATATGNATLSATNYNAVTWSAVSGATGYNIWGRYATGLGETYMGTVYGLLVYNDKGQDDPSLSLLPPEANTTTGVKGTMAEFAISRIFTAGDPAYPSRLSFGGTGENIGNFSGSSVGGGSVDVFRNDGSVIRAIKPFQGGVIIWKDNAIYKFSFTDTGLQKLEEITRSFGGISYRGIKHVENDIIFPAKKDGRLAIYSLGNQENYAATVLRTNELSIKIAVDFEDVNTAYLQYATAFYFNNIYGCAITTESSTVNDRIWCLDTRFGAWVKWEGLTPNCFSTYVDTDGSEKLYYGDESSGLVKKMFEDTRADSGVAISVEWATKAFNQKLFNKYKEYFDPTFQFKNIVTSSALRGDIILDGVIVSASFTINQQSTGGAGVGVYLVGFHLPGDAPNSTNTDSATSSDIPVEVKTTKQARSIKYAFRSNSATARYKFLSLSHYYMVLADKPLNSTNRVYVA